MCGASCGVLVRPADFDKRVRPEGAFHVTEDVYAKVKNMVLSGKIAPFGEGVDSPVDAPLDTRLEYEECPICCLEYPSLNRSECCGNSICSDCFFKVKTSRLDPYQEERNETAKKLRYLLVAHCPFCKCKPFNVQYRGRKTFEERQRELEEEERVRVALALCKKRQSDCEPIGMLHQEAGRPEAADSRSQEEEEGETRRTSFSRSSLLSTSSGVVVIAEADEDAKAKAQHVDPRGDPETTTAFLPHLVLFGLGSGDQSLSNRQRVEIERLRENQLILDHMQGRRNACTTTTIRTDRNNMAMPMQREGERQEDPLPPTTPVSNNANTTTCACTLSSQDGSLDLMNPFTNQKLHIV